MKYLFIGAHVDDVELSAGGTISKLVSIGHDVHVLSLSQIYDGLNLSSEWNNSMIKLGVRSYVKTLFETRMFYRDSNEILQTLFEIKKLNHDYIFAASSQDYHSDHATVGRCAERVFKNSNLITYTADWNTRNRRANYFVSLSQGNVEQKIAALSCYESQKEKSYMHPDYIWANALNNGVASGVKYAEAFQVVNMIQ